MGASTVGVAEGAGTTVTGGPLALAGSPLGWYPQRLVYWALDAPGVVVGVRVLPTTGWIATPRPSMLAVSSPVASMVLIRPRQW